MDANTVGIIIACLVAGGGFLVFVGKSVHFFTKLETSVDTAIQALTRLGDAFDETRDQLAEVRGDVKAIVVRVEGIERRVGPEDRREEERPFAPGRRQADGASD